MTDPGGEYGKFFGGGGIRKKHDQRGHWILKLFLFWVGGGTPQETWGKTRIGTGNSKGGKFDETISHRKLGYRWRAHSSQALLMSR